MCLRKNKFLRKISAYASKVSKAARIMCAALALLFAASLAVGLAIIFFVRRFEDPAPFARGLLLGAAVSAAKILLLENSIADAASMGKRAVGHILSRFALRSAATIAALALALAAPGVFGFVGTVVGVLAMAPSAIAASVALSKTQNG